VDLSWPLPDPEEDDEESLALLLSSSLELLLEDDDEDDMISISTIVLTEGKNDMMVLYALVAAPTPADSRALREIVYVEPSILERSRKPTGNSIRIFVFVFYELCMELNYVGWAYWYVQVRYHIH
jgi:hypothetical protein